MQLLQRFTIVMSVLCLAGGLALAGASNSAGQAPAQKPPAKPASAPKTDPPKHLALGEELDATLTMNDSDGKLHATKDYRGKILAIALWSIDCPTCKLYEARVKKLNDDYSSKGVVVLAVDPNEAESAKLKDFAAKNPLGASVLSDPGQKLVQRLGAASTPEIYLFDAKGMLRYKGAIDDDPKSEKADKATTFARKALDEMLADKPVTTSTTPATGSPIKMAPEKKPDAPPAKKPEEKPAPPAKKPEPPAKKPEEKPKKKG